MEENTNSKQGGRNLIGVVLVVMLLLVAGGYFIVKNNKIENQTSSGTSQVVADSVQPSAQPTGSVKEFTIDGSSYKFEPNKIEVNKGDTVKITFKDQDIMHDLVIDGYNVRTKVLKGGGEDTIQFVADKSGSFEYYCSVGNHKEEGMTGTLIVN